MANVETTVKMKKTIRQKRSTTVAADVDDRRRELPVAADSKSRLAVAHPGGEQPQLAEDRAQRRRLVAGHRGRSTGVADRVVCGGDVDHRRRRVADGWVMVRPVLATAGSRSVPSC